MVFHKTVPYLHIIEPVHDHQPYVDILQHIHQPVNIRY